MDHKKGQNWIWMRWVSAWELTDHRSDHGVTQWMKIASENGAFDITKVGWTDLVGWIARINKVK
jgi:hypothetical protein